MKKFPHTELILMALMAFIIAVSCGKPGTTTKTVIRYDTITTHPMIEGDGFVEWEFGDGVIEGVNDGAKDTVYIIKTIENVCPPTTVNNYGKQKRSNNVDNSIHLKNCFNENIDLKRSVLLYKGKYDSTVNILNGKKPVGEQTNIGDKWWKWLLAGIAIGWTSLGLGYFAFKAIKK